MPGTLIPKRSVYGDTGTYCGETFGARRWDRGDLITGSSYWNTVLFKCLSERPFQYGRQAASGRLGLTWGY